MLYVRKKIDTLTGKAVWVIEPESETEGEEWVSIKEAALRLNAKYKTIQYLINREHVETRNTLIDGRIKLVNLEEMRTAFLLPRKTNETPKQRAEGMYNLRLQGQTLEDIGREYGITFSRVRKIVAAYEKKYGVQCALDIKQGEREEKKRQERERRSQEWRQRNAQSPNRVPEISLDAHLIGKFLHELENRVLTYRWHARGRGRRDGTLYPCAERPTTIEFGDKEGKRWSVHAWVMDQYGLSVKTGEVIHRIDGDITNNMRENLQILTKQEHGRITYAENADIVRLHTRKLSIDAARMIRAAYAAGRLMNSLAIEYGVGCTVIWNIVHNKTYKECGSELMV